MALVTGRVDKVVERQTKFGAYFDIVVDGRKYGFAKRKPACFEGDHVSFAAEAKGDFWNADPTSLQKVAAPAVSPVNAAIAATSVAPTSGTKYAQSKDEYWANKEKGDEARQESITYQSARKDALQFVEILTAAGKIDTGKLKGADAIEALETWVDNYTQRFYEDTKNLGHKAVAKVSEDPNDSVEDI